ncbi:Alpha amylase, catalytic domain [Halobacillus dabanensis]|uniref:Alpha amylase, catalytic domain n=1 Tax=Halobacillus dabanensis TaxID=240302 RepID=A0A1I3T367_HALDA|nr:alpha-amylase family glycosyl hydrolase [Halobacillus dabanensis]SFJ64962.1 Alpha amylase, catalytic domain [Halobacillus dabanensis]
MRKVAMLFLVIPFILTVSLSTEAAEREERQWQDESIYYIVIDRFMNGNMDNNTGTDLDNPSAYHGGDLAGIVSQLDYIKEMGFTTIQLSPVMENEESAYHGFQVNEYREVEASFGSLENLKNVVDEAHAREMKVIFDLPIGFVGKNHPWMEDESKDDWFTGDNIASNHPWFEGLPEINTSNSDVQQFFKETMDYWQNETGVDGFRLISSGEVDQEWSSTGNRVLDIDYIDKEKPFRNEAREAFRQAGHSLGDLVVEEKDQKVHQLDFYDVSRFTHLAVEEGQNPVTRWRLALTYLFTSPGIPQLYYGTETPLDDGGNSQNLPMMNFKAGDEEIKKRIEKLTSMREQFPALTRGDYKELYNQDGLAVFQRSYQGDTMVIAINNAEETQSMELEDMKDDQQLRGLLHDGLVRQQKDGSYRLGMERETADVFVVESNSGYNWLFIGFVGGVLGLFVIAVILISWKNRKADKSS